MLTSEQFQDDRSSFASAVVVRTPTGRDAKLIGRLLDAEGLSYVLCGSENRLLTAAEEGVGPLLIAEEGLSDAGGQALLRILEGQPTWSDLPVILLARPQTRSAWSGNSLARRSAVRWLNRPIEHQTLLVAVRLAVDARQRQCQVAALLREQAESAEQLQRRAEQLRRLTVELIEAEDRERARLANLLHDDLQGLLVGAQLHLGVVEKQCADNAPLAQTLAQVRDLLQTAQRSSRNLSHELYPAALRHDDVNGLLKWMEEHADRISGVGLTVAIEAEVESVEPNVLRFCYRAIREILCNTAKHAGVDHVALRLRRAADRIELTIADEGIGFDPCRLEEKGLSDGLGLIAIRERIESLGGELVINSRPGAGSRITLVLPAAGGGLAKQKGPETTTHIVRTLGDEKLPPKNFPSVD